MPGDVVRPVRAARSGCATAPSLTPRFSENARTASSVACADQSSIAARSGIRSPISAARVGVEQARGLVVERQRPVGIEKLRAFDQIEQRLCALLQAGHRGNQFGAQLRRQLGGKIAALRDMRQKALDVGDKLRVRAGADVMAVEAFQLGEIEPRRRASDLRQVKRGDHFLGRENLLVAMRPAEPHEIIS